MSIHHLDELVLEPGVRFTHFFNGRMLSGEDLTRERKASSTRQRHLARALGSGVAFGLEVARNEPLGPRTAPVLSIAPGLAVAASGHTLRIKNAVDLAVVEPPAAAAPTGPGEFGDCHPLPASVYISGAGVYLLTIAPADKKEGSAPVSGLGNGLAPCNAKYVAEGVRFRLLPLTVAASSTADRKRNETAYQCFGLSTQGFRDLATNPFAAEGAASAPLASLVPGQLLTDCDVPLAILEWKSDGLGFIDEWAVRRRMTSPSASTSWGAVLGDRRAAEGEAMFLQFQAHANDLLDQGAALAAANAGKYFRWLPPLGVLPLTGPVQGKGFDQQNFFAQNTTREVVHFEGSQWRHALNLSFGYPPIDTTSADLIWLYFVRENQAAIIQGGSPKPAPYLVFSTGHMPYQGRAHFDLFHYNYGNYI